MTTTEGDLRPAKLTYEQIRARKQLQRRRVRVPLEAGPADDLEEAQRVFDDARARSEADSSPETKKAKDRALARLKETREAYEAASYEFVLQELPRVVYDELVSAPEHKPTKKQLDEAEKRGQFSPPQINPDTFAPVLLAACCVDPDLTEENTKEMWTAPDSSFGSGTLLVLYLNAQEVCQSTRIVDLGKDYELT